MFESWITELVVAAVGFIVVASLYFCRNYGHWKKKGIPYLIPLPIVGNILDVVRQKENLSCFMASLYRKNRAKPFVGIYMFDNPALLVNDLGLIKQILIKDFQVFTDRNTGPNDTTNAINNRTLFALQGQSWKVMRNHLTPTFTSGKMKNMFPLVENCGKQLAEYLKGPAQDSSTVLIKDVMARYTTDVIATCAFGIESNSLKDPEAEFRQMLRKVFGGSSLQSLAFTLTLVAPKLVKALRLSILDPQVKRFLRSTVWETIGYRQRHGVIRKDFLDLLIEMKTNGTEELTEHFDMEGDDLVAQAFAFLAAGFETSSTTMSFLLYELAQQPKLQQRLRSEMHQVLESYSGKLTYEAMQQMPYLDMVLAETLRKFPPAGMLARVCLQDYVIPGANVTLDKGTRVIIPLMGIHYDPEFYTEPTKFDPERFTDENKEKRPKMAYFPFGDGPRACIGMRFALMQVKTGLIHTLLQYEVKPCAHTPIPLIFDKKNFLLATNGDIPMVFSKVC